MPSLTEHLLRLDVPSLTRATQHPFLIAAATSALPLDSLQQWLAQDRLYALAYVNFIGSLLAQIRLPSAASRARTAQWKVADLLIDCLTNIRRELQLFDETAAAEGWLEQISDPEPARATRCYQDLFAGSTAQGRPLLVGLVVLWATEACYLRSWRFARGHIDLVAYPESAGGVMQRVFIPNWSSDEFEQFVLALENVVNILCRSRILLLPGPNEVILQNTEDIKLEEGGWLWKECEVAFRQVVWTEEMFWPNVTTEGKAVSQ